MAGINLEIRAAGLLMEKEIKFFTKLLKDPERPFALILGGLLSLFVLSSLSQPAYHTVTDHYQ